MPSAREMYEYACRQVQTPDPPIPWEGRDAETHWWYEQCWAYVMEQTTPAKLAEQSAEIERLRAQVVSIERAAFERGALASGVEAELVRARRHRAQLDQSPPVFAGLTSAQGSYQDRTAWIVASDARIRDLEQALSELQPEKP